MAAETPVATVDHSDIRGSKPHNRDPSGASSGLSTRVGSEDRPQGVHRGFSFPCAPRPLPALPPLSLCSRRNSPYAACRSGSLCAASTFTPMAQIEPNNSRPTAVTTTHQLSRPRKSRYFSQFRHDRHRRYLSDPPKCLQRLDHSAHLGRCQLHRFFDSQIKPRHPCCHMLHLLEIIEQRGFLRRLQEVHFSFDPRNVFQRPSLYTHGWPSAMP